MWRALSFLFGAILGLVLSEAADPHTRNSPLRLAIIAAACVAGDLHAPDPACDPGARERITSEPDDADPPDGTEPS
jgi:hypothetical protein